MAVGVAANAVVGDPLHKTGGALAKVGTSRADRRGILRSRRERKIAERVPSSKALKGLEILGASIRAGRSCGTSGFCQSSIKSA